MKVGIGTKTVIGVLGILAAGFIGLKVVTHSDDAQPPKTPSSRQTTISLPAVHKRAIRLGTQPNTNDKGNKPEAPPSGDKQIEQPVIDDVQDFLAWLDSEETENQISGMAQSIPDSTEDAKQQKTQNELANLEHQKAVEAVEQRMVDMVMEFGEVMRIIESFPNRIDGSVAMKYLKERRRLTREIVTTGIAEYLRLTNHDSTAFLPGGWFYKLSRENMYGYTFKAIPD